MMLSLDKHLHSALWGCESWEISAHPTDPSLITSGPWAGESLAAHYPKFPLLFKVIDAHFQLSVQVHPNAETCKITGGEPKTEMWCVLSPGPIYAGLKPGTTAAAIAAAVQTGDFESLLVRHDTQAGEVYYIPGGLVHAIGAGTRLYEVQQSSNTTFRLYDWGRRGADGRPRELHVDQALAAIDYTLAPPRPELALKTPFFDFSQITLEDGEYRLSADSQSCVAIYVASGSVEAEGKVISADSSRLLPPGASVRLKSAKAHLLLTRFAILI